MASKVLGLLCVLAVVCTACDPSTGWSFEFRNAMDGPVRIVVPELNSIESGRAWQEKRGIDLVLDPGAQGRAKLITQTGNSAGDVRVYDADGVLIFCSSATRRAARESKGFSVAVEVEITRGYFDADCEEYRRPLRSRLSDPAPPPSHGRPNSTSR